MRTALMLLLLLAVAAVPGSVLPQRSIDASRVADFLSRHTTLGPWLDRLSFFDVYASPWFASVYLLLTVSLVGCVVPRTRAHWNASRTPPPKAPAFPHRLPVHSTLEVTALPSGVADAARRVLRKRRYRLRDTEPARQGGRAVSAQRGGLREAGNLVFHTSLLVVIVAMGGRYMWGWRGDVIVPVGSSFTSTASGYGTFSPGPFVDPGDVPAFRVRVDRMDVSFEDGTQGPQLGAPRDFVADTTTWDRTGGQGAAQRLTVNGPLSLSGTSVFLLGNGYAPTITVRDSGGRVLYREATPFLPQDNNYRSVGAVKVPAASPKQLAFSGLFLPTAIIDPTVGPTSVFPDARAPALVLTAYEGDLFPGGRPQSVYSVNTTNLDQLRAPNGQPVRLWLTPGKTVQLPGGRGSITFERLDRFAGLSVRYDPGKVFALIGALSAATGLVVSLTVRRRRVFVTATPMERPAGGGPVMTRVVVAGLSRGHDPGLSAEVERVAAEVRRQLQGEHESRLPPPAASATGNTTAVEHDRDERSCRSTEPGNGRHAVALDAAADPTSNAATTATAVTATPATSIPQARPQRRWRREL
jgi:cytochrome c biogenesis protein